MVNAIIEYTESAFNHNIKEEDIRQALLNPIYDEIQDEGDDKHLLIGFDRSLNLLEIAYHEVDENKFKVFHAMKCRKSYYVKINMK